MSHAQRPEAPKHLPVVLADGTRTSISIPAPVFNVFMSRLGEDRARFNEHLKVAALSARPRPGVSRSLAIRFALEATLGEVSAPTPAEV